MTASNARLELTTVNFNSGLAPRLATSPDCDRRRCSDSTANLLAITTLQAAAG
jgi:hypothetical protein